MSAKILIIEDDPVIRKELKTLLEGNGYETSAVEDFADVMAQVRQIQPHLILLAKIASLLKRAYPKEQERRLSHGGVSLCLENGTMEANGATAELTKNETKIMYYLLMHAGKICTRADLIEYLWDNRLYVDDNALSVNIGRIREKLAKDDLWGGTLTSVLPVLFLFLIKMKSAFRMNA